jgi:hypothetical protein
VSASRRRSLPAAQGPSTATAALPHDDPRRERQQPPATAAREGLRPATPVPQVNATGQHDALAASPVRAGEHDPLPGLYASASHAPSVTAVARHFTVNRPEVERGCASREPAPQVHEPCARGRIFRVGWGGTPAGVEGAASGADGKPGPGYGPVRDRPDRRFDPRHPVVPM